MLPGVVANLCAYFLPAISFFLQKCQVSQIHNVIDPGSDIFFPALIILIHLFCKVWSPL